MAYEEEESFDRELPYTSQDGARRWLPPVVHKLGHTVVGGGWFDIPEHQRQKPAAPAATAQPPTPKPAAWAWREPYQPGVSRLGPGGNAGPDGRCR